MTNRARSGGCGCGMGSLPKRKSASKLKKIKPGFCVFAVHYASGYERLFGCYSTVTAAKKKAAAIISEEREKGKRVQKMGSVGMEWDVDGVKAISIQEIHA